MKYGTKKISFERKGHNENFMVSVMAKNASDAQLKRA